MALAVAVRTGSTAPMGKKPGVGDVQCQRVSERAAASAPADDDHVTVLGHQPIVEALGRRVITH
jgi:hypothetical protein